MEGGSGVRISRSLFCGCCADVRSPEHKATLLASPKIVRKQQAEFFSVWQANRVVTNIASIVHQRPYGGEGHSIALSSRSLVRWLRDPSQKHLYMCPRARALAKTHERLPYSTSPSGRSASCPVAEIALRYASPSGPSSAIAFQLYSHAGVVDCQHQDHGGMRFVPESVNTS